MDPGVYGVVVDGGGCNVGCGISGGGGLGGGGDAVFCDGGDVYVGVVVDGGVIGRVSVVGDDVVGGVGYLLLVFPTPSSYSSLVNS